MEFQLYKFNKNIHGLRGLAATFILILHFLHYFQTLLVDNALISESSLLILNKMASSLSSGVEFFFMISGFLITGSLLRHKNIYNFFIDRAIRIYPVFLAIHIPFFLIMPFMGWKWLADISFLEWLGHFISNALFLPGVFNLPIVQTAAWTLSYEFLFYLSSGLLFFLSLRITGLKKYILFTLILLPIFIIFPRGLYFLVGAVIFLLLKNKPTLFENKKFYPTLFFAVLLCIFGPLSYGFELDRAAIHADEPYTKIALLPACFFFIGIVRSQGIISQLLRTKFCQFLGKISYSMYLWHAVILFVFSKGLTSILLTNLGLPLLIGLVVVVLLFILITLIVSYISYYLLEDKLCNILKDHKIKNTRKINVIA